MTEHIYECPGYGDERSFSETVPMIPAWQYREDGRPVAPAAHVSPDSEAVWVYPPYSSEGTLEIVNELERLNLDERLARDNHTMRRFKTNSCTMGDEYTSYILHAHEPVQPAGLDATHTFHTTVSDKLGDLECHVCFEDEETRDYYVNEAQRKWDSVFELLLEEDMSDSGMHLRLISGLLCMLELRMAVWRGMETDAMTDQQAADVTSYVIIEHELRKKNYGVMDDAKWNFVRGIFAVRNSLKLF